MEQEPMPPVAFLDESPATEPLAAAIPDSNLKHYAEEHAEQAV